MNIFQIFDYDLINSAQQQQLLSHIRPSFSTARASLPFPSTARIICFHPFIIENFALVLVPIVAQHGDQYGAAAPPFFVDATLGDATARADVETGAPADAESVPSLYLPAGVERVEVVDGHGLVNVLQDLIVHFHNFGEFLFTGTFHLDATSFLLDVVLYSFQNGVPAMYIAPGRFEYPGEIGFVRIGEHHPQIFSSLLEIFPHAHDRPSRARRHDEMGHFAVGLVPNLSRGGFVMRHHVVHVLVLVDGKVPIRIPTAYPMFLLHIAVDARQYVRE
mmetsp:Transcript_9469/g.16487  ORF Transcript_9469/g.16487 Transcript_9469/m.16487 type:complete len:276 (+) Transcript_9469:48-875(+)